MVAQDNENRITDSSISISKGCTVSGVPDEYVHLCENKRLSIFTGTLFSVSISLPCAHDHKFTTKEAVHSDTLQLSLCPYRRREQLGTSSADQGGPPPAAQGIGPTSRIC